LTSNTSKERLLTRQTLSKFRPLGIEILLSLNPAPKDLSGLSNDIESLKTSILHEIKRLRAEQLVEKENSMYLLTGIGRIYAVFFDQFFDVSALLKSEQEFWLRHSISSIPEHLLLRIGDLKDSVVVRNDEIHLNRIHEYFLELLAQSTELKGISPVFHTDFAEAVAKMLMKNYRVRLVVTQDVLHEIQETVSRMDFGIHDMRLLIERNLDLYVTDQLKLALSATDSFISLGLFDHWENYDYNADIFCTRPQGIQWGQDLFEYYLQCSTKIDALAGRI